MNIEIFTDSIFDMYLTTLAWALNNAIWNLLVDTGIFLIPIAFNFLAMFMKVREQGADEGNKGALLLNWFENYGYFTVLFLFATCVPIFKTTVAINSYQIDDTCRALKAKPAPKKTAIGKTFETILSDKHTGKAFQPTLPLWWTFLHIVSKGTVSGMVNAIPCQPDFRKFAFELNSTRIKDPNLVSELADFNEQCFMSARSRYRDQMRANNQQIRAADNEDINWIGSKILSKGGFYKKSSARQPVAAFNNTYPTCYDWLNDPNIGLITRLMKSYDPHFLENAGAFLKSLWNGTSTEEERNDAMLKELIRPEKITANSMEPVYKQHTAARGDFSSRVSLIMGGFTQIFSNIGFTANATNASTARMFVEGLLIILMPLILVLSGYKPRVILTVSFAIIGLELCEFIFHLIEFFDNWLVKSLYNTEVRDSHDIKALLGFIFGGDNYKHYAQSANNLNGDIGLSYLIGAMYTIAPVILTTFLSWVGFNLGGLLQGAMNANTKLGDKTTQATKFTVRTAVQPK